MDGRTFEHYLRVVFGRRGFEVELTRYVGDYGADLIVRGDNRATVVQAKRSRRRVGVKAVQEAVAAKGYYGCDDALVVTNAYFTRQARVLAERNAVRLWSRHELVQELVQAGGKTASLADEPLTVEPSHRAAMTCVVCGKRVSEKVQSFCASQPQRFGGRTYCFAHQRARR
jgi:restriction system protein